MNELLKALQGLGVQQTASNMSVGSTDYLNGLNTGYINPNVSNPVSAITPQMSGWDNLTSGFFKSKDAASGLTTGGWGEAGLGVIQGLMNGFMGMKQYGLAKDTLAANKDQFSKNYAAQKATTNASLEDRQRARVASNSSAYQSVGDYMKQNGIV